MWKISRRTFLMLTVVVLGLAGLAYPAKADQGQVKKPEVPVEQPLSFVPGSWTLVVLPDIQNYSTYYPGLLNLQTQWIADNKEKHNIVYVLQNGDATNNNNELEWERASRAFGRLDGLVPYVIAPGNHDFGTGGSSEQRSTLMNGYFPPSRFAKWPSFGGVMEEGRLIIGLEWAPRDKTLEWAGRILRKFPKHKAIIMTHAYLYSDSTRYDWQKKGESQNWNPHSYTTPGGVNDGEEMWQKLVKKHENVFLVLNGHVLNDGLGFLVSEGDNGNTVYQMLVNFQMKPLGGESWLRLIEFLPDGQTIQVKNYCPLYEKYNTSPEDQFVIKLSQR
jgi:hypothetical protein